MKELTVFSCNPPPQQNQVPPTGGSNRFHMVLKASDEPEQQTERIYISGEFDHLRENFTEEDQGENLSY